jgi:parallel beta-helix repeat protein
MKIERHWRSIRSTNYLIFGMVLVGGLLRAEVGETAAYYVAMTGSDQKSCAQAQAQSTPKRTIQSGLACLHAGDTLYVKAGSYNEGEIVNPPGGTSWSNPVTIAGFPGETVTLTAPGAPRVFTFAAASSSYIILDNLVLDATENLFDAVKITYSRDASNSSHHIRIQNSEIKNAKTQGILVTQGSTGNEFLNLHVHHNGTSTSFDHGLYISGDHNIIRGCDIHDNATFGVHVYEVHHTAAHDNAVVGNRVHGHSNKNAVGILLSSGANNLAYNNLSYGNSIGIQVHSAPNAQIYNNTVYGNRLAMDIQTHSPGIKIQNNIVWQNTRNNIANQGNSPETIDHNLEGINPGFVNAANADFQLGAGSPAINAGIRIALVTTDFAGISRQSGGGYDIGAYAYIGNRLPSPSNSRVMSIK